MNGALYLTSGIQQNEPNLAMCRKAAVAAYKDVLRNGCPENVNLP